MMSTNSTTFFVSLPSNLKDYTDNNPSRFRIHLPKSIQFEGNWMCALQSIQFPISWPPELVIESGQYISIHLKDNLNPIHIYIPAQSFTSLGEFLSYINDLFLNNLKKLEPKSRKRRSTDLQSNEAKIPLIQAIIEDIRAPLPPPPIGGVPYIPTFKDGERAPNPPPPLEQEPKPQDESSARAVQEAAREIAAEVARKVADDEDARKKIEEEANKKLEEARKKIEEDARKKKEEDFAAKAIEEAAKKKEEEDARKKKEEDDRKKKEEESAAKTLEEVGKEKQKEESTAKAIEEAKEKDKENQPAPIPPAPKEGIPNIPSLKENEKAPDPPPPTEEIPLIQKIVNKLKNRGGESSTREVEVYHEPKVKERGILREILETLTWDLDTQSLRSSDAQIQAVIEGQKYIEQKEKLANANVPLKQNEVQPTEAKIPLIQAIVEDIRAPSPPPPLDQDENGPVYFEYLVSSDRLKININNSNIKHISMSHHLSHILGGFADPSNLKNNATSLNSCDFSRGISGFAVCAKDLTEQMILGNTTGSLLRIVSIESQYKQGMMVEKIYDSPMFMRVLPREINEIQIEIRTLSGHFVPFIYGTVIVTLVFKKLINY